VRDRARFNYEAAYLLPWKDAHVVDLESAGVPTRCLDGGREWDIRWAWRLRRLLHRRNYDLLHVHSPYVAGIARLVVRTLPPGRRPKVMTTEHLPWSGYALPTRLLTAATFAFDDADVAVSEAVMLSIPRRLRGKVVVEPNGIDLGHVADPGVDRTSVRRELGATNGEVLVATVANMRPQKDYPTLLRAAAIVRERRTDVRFVAIGFGALEAAMRQQHAALGLGDSFVFLGRVDEPWKVLAGCDLFVLSSLYEGLPLALIEALAVGLPVVATSVVGTTDVVTHGRDAILVPARDPERLANAILELADDDERRAALARAGRARAADFDIARMTTRIEEMYQQVAVGRSSGGRSSTDRIEGRSA
jgi:glycosyltransferase involved in cell wall biosynthesis